MNLIWFVAELTISASSHPINSAFGFNDIYLFDLL